jgi:glycosyltransferase involved in cell wall biosynthesis
MISVCVPVYNVDVRALIANLHQLATSSGINFEILVLDDASSDVAKQKQNAEVATAENIRYLILPKNIGRNLIRFELANRAAFDHILFLDADSSIVNPLFFSRYLESDWKNQLVIGGRAYAERRPDPDQLLHWSYGRKREQLSAEIRSVHPYRSFLACNFLIPKKYFFKLVVDPNLKGYCHEDTFMGMQFEKHQVPVQHINNPVVHLGLDHKSQFLRKQEEALHHLKYIYQNYKDTLPVLKHVKLLRAFERLKNRGLVGLYKKTFSLTRRIVLKNLSSDHPSLFLLDIYKLGVFSQTYSLK